MSEAVTKLFVAAVYVVTAVSLLLIAFSEERQEDEFIKSLRGRSLAAAACVAFVLPMFFLYIVIFKASLWVYRWRSRHEE